MNPILFVGLMIIQLILNLVFLIDFYINPSGVTGGAMGNKTCEKLLFSPWI